MRSNHKNLQIGRKEERENQKFILKFSKNFFDREMDQLFTKQQKIYDKNLFIYLRFRDKYKTEYKINAKNIHK